MLKIFCIKKSKYGLYIFLNVSTYYMNLPDWTKCGKYILKEQNTKKKFFSTNFIPRNYYHSSIIIFYIINNNYLLLLC